MTSSMCFNQANPYKTVTYTGTSESLTAFSTDLGEYLPGGFTKPWNISFTIISYDIDFCYIAQQQAETLATSST